MRIEGAVYAFVLYFSESWGLETGQEPSEVHVSDDRLITTRIDANSAANLDRSFRDHHEGANGNHTEGGTALALLLAALENISKQEHGTGRERPEGSVHDDGLITANTGADSNQIVRDRHETENESHIEGGTTLEKLLAALGITSIEEYGANPQNPGRLPHDDDFEHGHTTVNATDENSQVIGGISSNESVVFDNSHHTGKADEASDDNEIEGLHWSERSEENNASENRFDGESLTAEGGEAGHESARVADEGIDAKSNKEDLEGGVLICTHGLDETSSGSKVSSPCDDIAVAVDSGLSADAEMHREALTPNPPGVAREVGTTGDMMNYEATLEFEQPWRESPSEEETVPKATTASTTTTTETSTKATTAPVSTSTFPTHAISDDPFHFPVVNMGPEMDIQQDFPLAMMNDQDQNTDVTRSALKDTLSESVNPVSAVLREIAGVVQKLNEAPLLSSLAGSGLLSGFGITGLEEFPEGLQVREDSTNAEDGTTFFEGVFGDSPEQSTMVPKQISNVMFASSIVPIN